MLFSQIPLQQVQQMQWPDTIITLGLSSYNSLKSRFKQYKSQCFVFGSCLGDFNNID